MIKRLEDSIDGLEKVEAPLMGYSLNDLFSHPSYSIDRDFRRAVDNYAQFCSQQISLSKTLELLQRERRRTRLCCQADFHSNSVEDPVSTEQKITSNVTDVSGNIPVTESIGVEHAPRAAPTQSWTNVEFFKRPVLIASGTWEVLQPLRVIVEPWKLLLADPAVRSKIRNQWLLKDAKMNVRITVSGTQFHQGRLLVTYVPNWFRQPVAKRYIDWADPPGFSAKKTRLCYLSQMPLTTYIDPTDNQPLDLQFPLIKAQPYLGFNKQSDGLIIGDSDEFTDFKGLGVVYMESLHILEAVTSTPTNVFWTMYAWLSEVETSIDTGTKMMVAQSEQKTGPMQRVMMAGADIAKVLSKAPVIGPYAKAGEMIFGGLGRLAAVHGFSRPSIYTEPSVYKPQPFQNTCNVIGSETTTKLTIDPLAETSIGDTVTGDSTDQMHFNHILSREAYIGQVDWKYDSPIMTPISFIPIVPSHVTDVVSSNVPAGLSRVNAQPVPAAWLGNFFSHWRANKTVVRLDFMRSKFHTGKVGIMYEPNISQNVLITSGLKLNVEKIVVIDINEVTNIELEIGWNQPKYWAESYNASNAVEYIIDANEDYDGTSAWQHMNGFIVIFPLTELQSPALNSVHINVFIKFPDCEFNGFSSRTVVDAYMTWSAPPGPGLKAQSFKVQDSIALNKSSNSPDVMNLLEFGEKPCSWRTLLKRYTTAVAQALTPTAEGRLKYVLEAPIIPRQLLSISDIHTNLVATQVHLLSRIRMAYLAMKGSHKYKVTGFSLGSPTPYDTAVVALHAPSTATVTPSLTNQPIAVGDVIDSRGFNLYLPYSQPGVEVQLPFWNNNLFVWSQEQDPYVKGDSSQFMDTYAFRSWSFITPTHNALTANTVRCQLQHAIGDDFTLMYFVAAVPWSYIIIDESFEKLPPPDFTVEDHLVAQSLRSTVRTSFPDPPLLVRQNAEERSSPSPNEREPYALTPRESSTKLLSAKIRRFLNCLLRCIEFLFFNFISFGLFRHP